MNSHETQQREFRLPKDANALRVIAVTVIVGLIFAFALGRLRPRVSNTPAECVFAPATTGISHIAAIERS